MALCIYKTKVLPYFDYGDVFYIDTHVSATDKWQKLQNRALRICLKSARREPTENLHREAVIPLLSDRRLALLRNFMFKRKESGKFLDLTPPRTRVHDAITFRTVNPTNKSFERSIYFKGAREWNNLDINTRNLPTLALFKQHQKCWLKSTVT